MKKQNGITLIALVITIIVLLILAGVSINAIVGENGVLVRAQEAVIKQKLAKYKEELEINSVDGNDKIPNSKKIIAVDENSIRKYIPSIKEDDVNNFAIISGELYYVGEDLQIKNICEQQNIKFMAVVEELEITALENLVESIEENSFIQTDSFGNKTELGMKLKNKDIGVVDWKIIVEVENETTKATYGTDWYYLEKDTYVNGIGNLKNSYIINCKTDTAIEFDQNTMSILSYGSKLAVTEGLIFEISPSMIEKGTIDSDSSVVFGGYQEDLSDAFTKSSFIFDGVDDYIGIPCDNTNNMKTGFTYQFHGKYISHGTDYKDTHDTEAEPSPSPLYPTSEETYDSPTSGIMCAWAPRKNAEELKWDCFIRFGLKDENDKFNLIYNVGKKDNEYTSSFSDPKFSFNQNIPLENIGLGDFKYGDELSYAVTIDPTTYTQTIYVNGLPVASGDYSKEQWDEFASELASRIEYYYIGRSSYDNRWHYSNTEIYGLSLYNRALNAEEILANYNAMVSYHDILENGSEVKTTE